MKKAWIMLALTTGMLCLVSCAGADKKELAEDYEKLESAEATTEEKTQPAANEPFHVNDTVQGGSGELHVDADVCLDGAGRAKVYQINRREVDGSYMQELAAKLFDGGSYEVIKPYELWDKQELEAEIERMHEQELVEDREAIGSAWGIEYAQETELFYGKNAEVGSFETEDEVIYKMTPQPRIFVGGYGIEGMDVAKGRIRGRIGGRPCDLSYTALGENPCLELEMRAHTVAGHYYSIESDTFQSVYGENLCSYEEALSQAEEVLQKSGITDFKQAACFQRLCQTDAKDNSGNFKCVFNGYRFYYVPCYDEISAVVGVSSMGTYEEIAGESVDGDSDGYWIIANRNVAYQPMITVEVDQLGLTKVRYGQLFEKPECIEQTPKLLTFEQAQEAVSNFVKTQWPESTNSYYVGIGKIEFSYIQAEYDGKISIVPAWVFYRDNHLHAGQQLDRAWAAVNALDGSVFIEGGNYNFFYNDFYL